MRVLVACEESQRVCIAFRDKGHEAYSCDIVDCSGGHPEWHIKQDVLPLLDGDCWFFTCDGLFHRILGEWDMIIAHPPCTFISAAGACRMFPVAGCIDENRFLKALAAKEFFMKIFHSNCSKICIENPKPLTVVGLPLCTQKIHPYMFGHPYSKLTYLWLKGLPLLTPTAVVTDYVPYISSNTSRNKGVKDKAGVSRSGGSSLIRSKTFFGIAAAMAEQWG